MTQRRSKPGDPSAGEPGAGDPNAVWEPGPERPLLTPDEIHVWWAPLPDLAPDAAWAVLQPDEFERAQSARSEVFQAHYVASRGILRRLLGRYLGCAPASVRLQRDERQKPALAAPAPITLEFNISHSSRQLLLAFSRCGPVGVDIERADHLQKWQRFARIAFSAAEIAGLNVWQGPGLDANPVTAALAVWVRKEAYTKARGTGLGHGFTRFTVSTAPAGYGGRLLLHDATDGSATEDWWIADLPVDPGFGAAVAGRFDVHARRPRLRLWSWTEF